jgi:hypothetical protein
MVRVQVPNVTADQVALQLEQDRLIRQGKKAGTTGMHHGGGRAGASGPGGHGQGHGLGHGQGHGLGHGQGHGLGHGIGHRKHKPASAGGDGGPEGAVGGAEDPALQRTAHGKHAGHGVHGGHKTLRSMPSMKAPGEEENESPPAA